MFNRWDLNRACLESLRRHTLGKYLEVIAVDNHSDDLTATELEPLGKSLFGADFHALRQNSNLGFAAASNLGARAATAPYLFFLNNDTLLTPNWSAPLLAALRDSPRLGAVGPLLLYPEGERVQHLGIAFNPYLATEHLYANFPAGHPAVSAGRRLQAITGAAMLMPKDLFLAAGGFHEGYRNGCEDLELCGRLRELGKEVAVIPQSRIIHLESQTPGRSDHDSANFKLLNERCLGCFAPDLHKLAKQDGFELGLTPWLETFVCLPAWREAELCASHAPAGAPPQPGLWWEILQKEPLWQTGYALLAEYLEQAGGYAEAAGVRLLEASFFPFLTSYRALARVASLAENVDLAGQSTSKIEQILGLLNDADALAAKARGMAKWARRAGEADLEMLYSGWLRNLGLPVEE